MLEPDDLAAVRAAQIDTMGDHVEICAVVVTHNGYGVATNTYPVLATPVARVGLPGGVGSSMRHLVEALRDQGKLRTHTRILTLPFGTALTTQQAVRHAGAVWEVVGLADDHTHATALRAVITRDEGTPV